MNILVTYGSAHGGTAGLAEAVAEGIEQAGHHVDVRPAREVEGLEAWDGVVVGGALYAWIWQKDARRFVHRHAHQLVELPVWFFSSGPLDESASQGEIEPTWTVRRLMERVDARGHKTFGGRMDDPSKAEMPQGDWRDMDQAADWGGAIADELAELHARTEPLPPMESGGQRFIRRLVVALCYFTGLTATVGGLDLFFAPRGGGIFDVPPALLDGTPFESFRLPGLLLFAIVGLSNLVAGRRLRRRQSSSEIAAVGAGGILTAWILTQMAMVATAHWLQLLYLSIGVVTMLGGFWLWARLHLRGSEPATVG
jgi:menaquinone-dependent protoporphyrinogen oxidase